MNKWTREYKLGQPAYRYGPYFISRRFETGYLGGGRLRSRVFFVVEHNGILSGHHYTLKAAKAAVDKMASLTAMSKG